MAEYGYNNQGSNQPPIPPSNYSYANQQYSHGGQQSGGYQASAGMTQPYVDASAYETPAITETPTFDNARPAAHATQGSATKAATGKQRGGFGRTFVAGFLGAALACSLAGGGFAAYSAMNGGDNGSNSSASSTVLGSSSSSTIEASEADDRAEAVADKVLPSVVGIDVYTNSGGASGWGSLFDSGSDSLTYSGLGSGVIISADGYILTNYHVVEGADALQVTANGQEYEAQVVGVDESSDLAVVKVDASDLTPIELGESAELVPGQWVMTVGSPFGLEQSVATGIVSATSRTVTVQDVSDDYSYYFGGEQAGDVSIYSNMIQTDAAINPGNSGGALVDANGRLIGINAVIESYSGSYSGVGFAIPVDYAIGIAQQIIDGETPTHAQLGVSATTITSDIASRYDLGVDSGAYVSAVYEGSAADTAGLQQGDIITAVDDTKVADATDLVAACRGHQVGDNVTIAFVRDGQTQTVDVTLGSDEQALGGLSTEESTAAPEQDMDNPHGWMDDSNQGYGFDFGFGQGYDGAQDESGQLDAAA